jgi:hypothetical protein
MKFTQQTRPLSYLASHTLELVKRFDAGTEGPLILTHDGEAKMVVIGIKEYQEALEQQRKTAEQVAFMKLIVMGDDEIAEGRLSNEKEFWAEMDKG